MHVIQNSFWYVINPKERNIQALRLDDIPFAKQTDYILANARLHTNPSDWIKIKHLSKQVLYFLPPQTGLEPVTPTLAVPKSCYPLGARATFDRGAFSRSLFLPPEAVTLKAVNSSRRVC